MVSLRVDRTRRNVGSVLALWLVSACSSPNPASATSPDAGAPTSPVSCAMDPRVDHYAAGLTRRGRLDALSFRLADSYPEPPARGANTFVLEVADGSGAVPDVTLGVDLKMPDHGHGTAIVPAVDFDPAARTFTIAPLYFFMPGIWRIDFTAYPDSGDTSTALDDASFFFCVEG